MAMFTLGVGDVVEELAFGLEKIKKLAVKVSAIKLAGQLESGRVMENVSKITGFKGANYLSNVTDFLNDLGVIKNLGGIWIEAG